jgi:hypothetical protein
MGRGPCQVSDQARVLRYLQARVGEPVQIMTLARFIWSAEAQRIVRRLEQARWPITREHSRVTLHSLERGTPWGFRSPWSAVESQQVRKPPTTDVRYANAPKPSWAAPLRLTTEGPSTAAESPH